MPSCESLFLCTVGHFTSNPVFHIEVQFPWPTSASEFCFGGFLSPYMALALCGCSVHSLTPPVVVATSFLPGLGAALMFSLVTVASTKVLELKETGHNPAQPSIAHKPRYPHPFIKALWPFLPLFCHLPLRYGFFRCVPPWPGYQPQIKFILVYQTEQVF